MSEPEGNPLSVEVEGLTYTLDRPPNRGGKRVIITVATKGEVPELIDRIDLYSHRARLALANLVSETFGRSPGNAIGSLAVLLDQVERANFGDVKPEPVVLAESRKKAAEKLLERDDVLDRAAGAMESLGHVGEEQAKRLCYLVATSRLMEKPLSVLLLAPSASGKSAILDAVAGLMPEEQVVPLARLTAQSLYYMGADALRNKVVLVDEYEGTGDADHPLRVLQSRGELRLATTVKGKSESFVVNGPVAVMSGTTATNVDVQNSSRCLTVSLDDGPAQTRRVQAAQAEAWAGERRARADLDIWRDAQRVLKPVTIAIPFATRLSFPSRTATDRRLSAQVLGLVAAHALLHQRRRDRDREGRVVATVEDYKIVYELLKPVVAEDLGGLPPRAARVYMLLAEDSLTRRQIADKLGWSFMTASRAISDLVAHELVRPENNEVPVRYRLVGRGALLDAPTEALTNPETLV